MSTFGIDVGIRLKRLRELRGESQESLANAIGIPRETIRNWEIGKRQIKVADVVLLSRHFNVTTDFILGMETNTVDLAAVTSFYTRLSAKAVHNLHKASSDKNLVRILNAFLESGFAGGDKE